MSMKVFGIGLNKTGTKSLGHCFTILGYNNKSFDAHLLNCWKIGNIQTIFDCCEVYDSFEDWPWPLVYKELDQKYPDAKFILTLRRDPETWYNSLCRHSELTGPTEARKFVFGYDMPGGHKERHIEYYVNHQESVTHYFKNRKEKLLTVTWENGDGWPQITSFLKSTINPTQPFPYLNRSKSVNSI